MKLKKLISMGLATVMTVCALVACGNTDGDSESKSQASAEVSSTESQQSAESQESTTTSEEASNAVTFPLKETMTFTGFSMMNKTYKLSESPVLQKTLEDANLVFELTEVPSTEVKEKGNLLMTSGEYPDMLFKSNLDCNKFGMEGILIPLEDLIREHAPNLTALLDERGDAAWKELQASDGHIYSMPRISNPGMYQSSVLWINKTWLDNLGLKEPNNMEDLYNVLKAFKEQDANGNGDPNDEIPMTCYDGGIGVHLYYNEFGHIYNHLFAMIDDQFVFLPTREEYRDQFLAYYAKCYEEGLLDPLSFTQTLDQMKATGASGDVLGVFGISKVSTVTGENDRWANYVPLKLTDCVLPLTSGLSKNGLAITDKCKNPEVLVAWADYFYSEEGSIVSQIGFEGVNHIMNEDGTFSYINLDTMPQASWAIHGFCPAPTLVGDVALREKADPITASMYSSKAVDELVRTYGEVQPLVVLTDEESKRASDLNADIKAYVYAYRAEVITGIKSLDDTWDEYCATLEKMGVKEYEKIYQEAYARTNQ